MTLQKTKRVHLRVQNQDNRDKKGGEEQQEVVVVLVVVLVVLNHKS